MIEIFEARACTVQAIEELNTFLIALADEVESPAQSLELQRSLELDEQDNANGMDTYCIVTATGATHYGGILSCTMTENTLTLDFSREAETDLGLRGYEITLNLPASDKALLRSGLKSLFNSDKNRPKSISL